MWTSSGARLIRSRQPASSVRSWRNSRRVSSTNPTRAGISSGCWSNSRNTTSRSSCGIEAGATSRSPRSSSSGRSAPRGRKSTSRSSRPRSGRTCAPTCRSFYYLRLHGRNAAEWWKHEKSEDRYNYLYSADELKPFAEAAGEASRAVKKAYSLRQQSLLGQGRGQCGHPQASTRTAAARRVPGGVRRALSRPEGAREVAAAVAHSFTEAFLSTSVF